MFHHKLGWQTSDQQDKAVSCEVGVLLVLASVLQAVWGLGERVAALQALCCLGPAGPRGQAPPAGLAVTTPRPPTPTAPQ